MAQGVVSGPTSCAGSGTTPKTTTTSTQSTTLPADGNYSIINFEGINSIIVFLQMYAVTLSTLALMVQQVHMYLGLWDITPNTMFLLQAD